MSVSVGTQTEPKNHTAIKHPYPTPLNSTYLIKQRIASSLSFVTFIEFHKVLHIFPAPKEHRAALMDARWNDVKDPLCSRSRNPSGLSFHVEY